MGRNIYDPIRQITGTIYLEIYLNDFFIEKEYL